jgi:hypothetical protein
MSTIIHGIDALTPFRGRYCCLREASLSFVAVVAKFEGFFGSLSA